MASLKIVPYQYVPTKRPTTKNHSHSSINTQTGAHRSPQESERGVLPKKALRFPIEKTPSDIRGPRAGKVSNHGNVQGMITNQLAGRGIQDSASVVKTEVFPSVRGVYQHTFGAEVDYAQIESVENDDIDIDFSGSLDSLFSDFDVDRYFVKQKALLIIEYNASRVANLSTNTPANHNDGLVLRNEFKRSNTLGFSNHRLKKQRGNTKRKRSQSDSLVVTNDNSDSEASESDIESVFENNGSKRSKSGSWGGS